MNDCRLRNELFPLFCMKQTRFHHDMWCDKLMGGSSFVVVGAVGTRVKGYLRKLITQFFLKLSFYYWTILQCDDMSTKLVSLQKFPRGNSGIKCRAYVLIHSRYINQVLWKFVHNLLRERLTNKHNTHPTINLSFFIICMYVDGVNIMIPHTYIISNLFCLLNSFQLAPPSA